MLTARLFAGLAVLFASAGLISRRMASPSLDIALYGTYFVISRGHLLLISAVISVLYALLYYVSAKTLHLPTNDFLSVVQFALTFLGLVGLNCVTNARIGPGWAIYVAEASIEGQWSLSMVKVALGGYISFLLGSALFVFVLALAVSQKLLHKNV